MRQLILIILLIPFVLKAQDCSKITYEKDKFTGIISYSSPLMEDVYLSKSISENGDTLYMLRLKAYSNSISFGEGAVILFDTGQKIVRDNNKIDIKLNSGYVKMHMYYITTYISIEKHELELLSNRRITDYRVWIYDQEVKSNKADVYRRYASCILNK